MSNNSTSNKLSLINPIHLSTNINKPSMCTPCIYRHNTMYDMHFSTSPIPIQDIPYANTWWKYQTCEDLWRGIDQIKYKQQMIKELHQPSSQMIDRSW